MEQREVDFSPKLISDLLAIIHNAIIVIDAGHRIILTNSRAARMFGTTVDELRGVGFAGLFMPEDRQVLVVNILTLTREQGEFEGEAMLKRPDGSCFLGLLAGTCFRWSNQESGMAFTIHDITKVKAVEHSLKESERIAFFGRLINDISHQLRNPVSIIGGFARRLEADGVDPAKVRPIMNEVAQVEGLLTTVGRFIRLPAPRPRKVQLRNLVAAAEERLREVAGNLGCTLRGDYDEEALDRTLFVDQELLLEAFEAVVVNSCESYPESATEKTVLFQVRRGSDEQLPFEISVMDQGMGISADNLSNVFAHFFSNKTHHIGLGLTFAARIVAEQLGRLSIASTPGRGTSVIFKLVRERRRPIRSTILH